MGLPRRVLEETAIEEISSTFEDYHSFKEKNTIHWFALQGVRTFSFGQHLLIEHNQKAQELLEAARIKKALRGGKLIPGTQCTVFLSIS